MSDKPLLITFITYTKGTIQFVTTPTWESQFLDWLNKYGNSQEYERKTYSNVGIRGCVLEVHKTEKREATILTLVKEPTQ